MAQTPNSNADPYCTAAQALLYRDVRQWQDLLGDADARPAEADLLDDQTAAGAKLRALLASASGEIEENCLPGKRYDPTDLVALTGNMAARLQEIVADLAFWRACKRRWPDLKRDKVSGAKEAEEALMRLASGEAIFGHVESAAAGLPKVVPFAPAAEADRLVGFARRFFGDRGRRGGC